MRKVILHTPNKETYTQLLKLIRGPGVYLKVNEDGSLTMSEAAFRMKEGEGVNGMIFNAVTEQQKKHLKEGNIALLKMGVIDSKLNLVNPGYVLEFLFEKYRKEIEKKAQDDVQAELERRAAKK